MMKSASWQPPSTRWSNRSAILYRSLEQKVEERSRQLRTASEIGHLATSASSREEIIERAVKLVIDRFGYSYASIFLLDSTGSSAVLLAAYSQSGPMKDQKGYRIPVTERIPGRLGGYPQPGQGDGESESAKEFDHNEILLKSSRAEIALPIAVGTR